MRPPRHLLLLTRQPGQTDEHVIEVTLAAVGGQTSLVWEERGMPLDQLAAYGAGIQVHVEDLTAYLVGGSAAMPTRGGPSSCLAIKS